MSHSESSGEAWHKAAEQCNAATHLIERLPRILWLCEAQYRRFIMDLAGQVHKALVATDRSCVEFTVDIWNVFPPMLFLLIEE